MASRSIVFVADAHVASGCPSEAEFRAMLEALSRTDYDLVFLGDIMDLWIGKDAYEDDLQRFFVAWCKHEKERRNIIYIEGNHEFFVANKYDGLIGTVKKGRFQDDILLAEHGHNIGFPLSFNRLFIAICKSGFVSFLLDVLPCGQKLALWTKHKFGSNGRTFFSNLPNGRIQAWAERMSRKTEAKEIFIGHFHTFQEFNLLNGTRLTVLPAWKNNQAVMLFSPDTHNASICHWRNLP